MKSQNPFAAMDYAGLFAAIVNSVEAVVISKTLDGTVLSWNPAAERILGWTADEMIGQSIRRIIPPDRQAEEDRILERVGKGENSIRLRTQRLRRDGSLVHLEIMVSPVRDAMARSSVPARSAATSRRRWRPAARSALRKCAFA